MASIPALRRHASPLVLAILSGVFVLIVISVMAISYLVAQRTSQRMQAGQELNYQAPTTPTKRQIRRLILERPTENGIEYLEIDLDGTVTIYDAQRNVVKSALQGLGRITSLYSDINKLLQTCVQEPPFVPNAYKLTIMTNMGLCVYYIPYGTGGGQGSLISGIEDLVEDTFAPTPTIAPTTTPYPGYVSPTPVPTSSYPTQTPAPTPIGGGPTPTPLPGYLTAPPFKCSDYDFDHPFTISNVICGVDD